MAVESAPLEPKRRLSSRHVSAFGDIETNNGGVTYRTSGDQYYLSGMSSIIWASRAYIGCKLLELFPCLRFVGRLCVFDRPNILTKERLRKYIMSHTQELNVVL
uniref:Uncharacterized protein n=1 Tax=Triticum urartu TaxID=4572 RepID=A0A8R7P472_TRIUA